MDKRSSTAVDTITTVCRHTRRAQVYRFGPESGMRLCAQCAMFYRPVLRRSIAMAVVVGSLLTLINQGDVLLHGHATTFVVLKICLTYVVPFCVSTISALAANHV
jgi:hypothetical protein